MQRAVDEHIAAVDEHDFRPAVAHQLGCHLDVGQRHLGFPQHFYMQAVREQGRGHHQGRYELAALAGIYADQVGIVEQGFGFAYDPERRIAFLA